MDKLAKDPRFLYSNDDDGRKAALAEYKHLIDAALSHCGQLFLACPKAKVEVRRVEAFKEATAPGGLL